MQPPIPSGRAHPQWGSLLVMVLLCTSCIDGRMNAQTADGMDAKDAPPAEDAPSETSTPPEDGEPPSANNDDTPMPGVCDAPDPTPVRRLSHFEYWNTLHALYPEVAFPDIPLPADNRPHEFDNDAEALKATGALVERYMTIAKQLVGALRDADKLKTLVPCADPAPVERADILACGEEFVRTEGARLFRRPLTTGEVTEYMVLFEDEELQEASFAQLQGYTLQLMMAAPEFLYRFEKPSQQIAPGESAPLDAWALASRLSYFLWGSAPDAELRQHAADGSLNDPEVLRAQAERMLADERARGVFVHFHEQWLDMERLDVVVKKDEENFDGALRDAMWMQGLMFIDQVLYADEGTIEDIFTSPRTFINDDLAPLYGEAAPAEQEWAEISPEGRAGWLTQPAFLASHGHPDKPSPVLRGTFVLDRVLCKGVGAPPPNAEAMGAAKEEEASGPLTNRELYDLTTNSEAPCTGCHVRINPPGYALESFDTMGRWRTQESNGLPIDTTGSFDDFAFDGAKDLATQLAASEQVETCVTKKWLRYAWSGGPLESSPCLIQDVIEEARSEGGAIRIKDLQLAIVTHPWFAMYTAPVPEEDAQ